MAYSTLAQLRAFLNTELGRTDGSTTPWGSDSDCNRFVQVGIRRLWPRVARLVRETVTPTDDTMDYTLTGIRDIVRVDVLDSDGLMKDEVRSWELIVDESADPVVRRLLVPEMATTVTLRVTGYQPYSVPSAADSQCDLPPELEHVAIAGAKVEAFKPRVASFLDYEQRGAQNPTTATGGPELLQMYFAARDDFDRLLADYQRNMTAGRRAKRTVR